MRSRYVTSLLLGAGLALSCAATPPLAFSQEQSRPVQTDASASPAQRLDVMRSRLDAMRRSLNSAIAALGTKGTSGKKDDAEKKEGEAGEDSPTRLRGLEKEVSSLISEVSNVHGKVDRSERIEAGTIDKLEVAVSDLNTRVDAGLRATASERRSGGDAVTAASSTASSSSKSSKKKKGGLFSRIWGRGGSDSKYDELTGTIAPGRDRQLFEDAAKEVRKGNYDTGRLLFNTIITTYPDSPFLPLAKLAIADSFYLEGSTSALIQAASAYQDWLTFFPTDPLADDVMMKVAECEMRQMGLADRDVTHASRAEQRLKVTLQQFPNTSLRPEVETRLKEVQENLAMHSLGVARYYYDKNQRGNGGLKGAQARLREIVEKYPNFSYMDEVLFKLGNLYVQEEEPDEAAKYYQRIARDYPNSDYAEKAREQLGVIGAPVPEPNPERKNTLPPERPSFTQTIFREVVGTTPVTINKNGVLISKDGKAGDDLIDKALANNGQLPVTTPTAPVQRRPPARKLQQTQPPAVSTSTIQTGAPAKQNSTNSATTTTTTPPGDSAQDEKTGGSSSSPVKINPQPAPTSAPANTPPPGTSPIGKP